MALVKDYSCGDYKRFFRGKKALQQRGSVSYVRKHQPRYALVKDPLISVTTKKTIAERAARLIGFFPFNVCAL